MKVLKILGLIIIVCSFILVGTPIKYNCLELNIIITLIGTMVMLYKIAIKKEKLINKKIDIVVLVFCISPLIPLIFKSYSNLEDTIILLIKNISIYSIYYIVKQIIIKNEENKKIFINTIIASGVILAIIGIEELTCGIIYENLKIIGIPHVMNIEHRMFSSLGYANSFAIIMAIDILLCLNRFKEHKIIYGILIIIFGTCLILTYSRGVLIMFTILYLLYLFLIKRNTIKLKYIIMLMIIILLFIIFYIIGINLDVPLEIFKNGESNNQIRRNILNVGKNKEYTFVFDIQAKSSFINTKNYTITIREENKYYDKIEEHKIEIGNEKGKKEIKFTTSSETVDIVIFFNSSSKKFQQGLTINSLQINGEKFPLNYAYLPVKLVEKIQSISSTQKSSWERGVYFIDSLKIIRNNIFFGTGGRGWLYNYEDVQSYYYESTESHSFISQTFIETGIIGFISLMTIILYSIRQILSKKEKISEIDIAFILLTLHSFIDFNISFYCIMVLWITLFAIITTKNNNNEKNLIKDSKETLSYLIGIIIILVNIIGIVLGISVYKIRNDKEKIINNIEHEISSKDYNEVINNVLLYKNYEDKYDIYKDLMFVDYSLVDYKNLEKIYNELKNTKIIVNTTQNVLRNELIRENINNLK